jgi:glycerophosphoryl diester phosphodiesterase
MNVEIKPASGAEAATGEVVGTLVEGSDDVLLSSFSVEALEAARAVAPQVGRGLLVGRPPRDVASTARALGCSTINVAERHVDAALVADLHAAGFAVLAYTIVDADRASALDGCGVDATFVDRLDRVPYEG